MRLVERPVSILHAMPGVTILAIPRAWTRTAGTMPACSTEWPALQPLPVTARYRCVLAAARDGQMVAVGEGAVEGVILAAPRGTGGFGYDPLFLLPDHGLTMAEIDLATKLGLSHRGRALRALLAALHD